MSVSYRFPDGTETLLCVPSDSREEYAIRIGEFLKKLRTKKERAGSIRWERNNHGIGTLAVQAADQLADRRD